MRRHWGEPAASALFFFGLASCGAASSSEVCPNPAEFTGRTTCTGTGRGGSIVATDTDISLDISAKFWDVKVRDNCEAQPVGPCTVTMCTPSSSGSAEGLLSAGHLRFRAGNLAAFDLPPSSDPSYSLMALPGALFDPGTPLTISATGGTFPAFSTSFCEEGRTMFTSPLVAPPNPAIIDRSQDLAVTWEGPGAGVAEIEIDDQSRPLVIKCDFPLEAGTGAIPSDVLMLVNPGRQSLKATEWIRASINVGDACVDVEISVIGVGLDRTRYDGNPMFI